CVRATWSSLPVPDPLPALSPGSAARRPAPETSRACLRDTPGRSEQSPGRPEPAHPRRACGARDAVLPSGSAPRETIGERERQQEHAHDTVHVEKSNIDVTQVARLHERMLRDDENGD